MKLLDLFCGAGGATKGYADAGFEVVGVDIKPQPNYPYEFIQADALNVLLDHDFTDDFDVIHASAPCQAFSPYRRKGHGVGAGYPNLIPWTRRLLIDAGRDYVIENVPQAPLLDPVILCGSMFGLDVRRHRAFETSFPLTAPPCNHKVQKPGRFPGATNRAPMSRATVEVGVWRIPLDVQQRAMGIDWMTREELSEAIPPAYTHHIGQQTAQYLRGEEMAA